MYLAELQGLEGSPGNQGTWQREARHALMLAAELDVALDREMLILANARELLALRLFLQHALRTGTRPAGATLATTWPLHWLSPTGERWRTPLAPLSAWLVQAVRRRP